jgi:tetratricopeptide (TPR) repeat protein
MKKTMLLVLKIKSEESAYTENLLFYFDELGWDKGMLVLQWERTKIRIPIEVDVDTKAWAEIQEALKNSPEDATVLRNAARYCADTKLRVDEGLKYIKKAQELKSSWFNLLIEARLFAAKKDYKSAKASAQKAIDMGEKDAKERGTSFTYKKMIEDEMAAWN